MANSELFGDFTANDKEETKIKSEAYVKSLQKRKKKIL